MTPLAKRLEDAFVQLSDAPAGIVVRHPDVAPLLAEVTALEARIAELESRLPVVCGTCRGTGARRTTIDDGFTPCPDCGKDGCGAGVRWVTP